VQAVTIVRRRLQALSVFLVLILLGVVTALSLRPPEPQSVSAPANRFSADRAVDRLDGIAKVPHPTGSAAQTEVREYLLGQLRKLGFEPEVVTRVAARTFTNSPAILGTVSDIHARIAGRQPTGRVLLVAHYDSVPIGPGASDDGSNVAAILEVARALKAGPQPRNDIDLLLTDGEEPGLLGAQAFVDSGRAGAPGRVVVVNLEARGVSGPAVMFQTAGTGLVPAVRAAGAVATSLADEIYGMLPNDTDLTVFDKAGMRGINFAFMGGAAHYHTAHDDIGHVSRASVQDMGDAALGATRELAAADLAAGGSGATFFSLFGTVVSYPGWLVLPLGGITAIGYLLLLWTGRRRGLSLRGAGRAAATFPLTLVGGVAIGLGVWWLLTLVRPEFALTAGNLYHLGRYALGEAALLLVLLVGWYRWARRKASALDVAVGVLGWFGLLALACAVLLPGGAYLFTWPALLGVAAVAAALRFTDADSPWRALAGCAAAVPGVALLLPIALMLLPTLGLSLTAASLVLAALLTAVAAGLVEPLRVRRALTVGMLAVTVAGVCTIGIGAAAEGYDSEQPRAVSLGYALEADTGKAMWVSLGGTGQPEIGRYLTGGQVRLDDRVPPLGGAALQSGKASVATAPAGPRAEKSSATEENGVRTMRVRIRVPADAYSVAVYADTTQHDILGATVEGASLRGGLNIPDADGGWRWSFSYAAPPSDGMDVRIRARGDGPLRLRVVTSTAGLPSGVGAPTLSRDVAWAGWPSVAGQTFVVRTFRL